MSPTIFLFLVCLNLTQAAGSHMAFGWFVSEASCDEWQFRVRPGLFPVLFALQSFQVCVRLVAPSPGDVTLACSSSVTFPVKEK